MNRTTRHLLVALNAALLWVVSSADAREAFQTPGNGQNFGVWRITDEPEVRHWANYHNTRCWSPDGRYLCYTRHSEEELSDEVFLYDAHADAARRIERGAAPRWAHRHNWLFYRYLRRDGSDLVSEIICFEPDSGRRRVLASIPGEIELGEPDGDDQWLYGGRLVRHKQTGGDVRKERSALRIRMHESVEVQSLPSVRGYQFLPNPQHPLFFTRWKGDRGDFSSSRLWYDLDGRNERIGIPVLQNAHTSWLGNGEYHLLGNGLVRGRRWNEPFPSDLHVLAAVQVGDVSPCGDSGRYATGDHNIADLRCGDGWTFLYPLSHICFPATTGDASTIFDADPKGSPDGTKVAFVSNYDLKDGPLTFVTVDLSDDADELRVESTARFPEQGEIVVRGEIIAYQHKTPQAFAGLSGKRRNTPHRPVRSGADVTLFSARLLTDAQWQRIGKPSKAMCNGVGRYDPILLRQRQTDVYVAIVRLPDAPHLRLARDKVELIPAEEHRETLGYHLLCDGRRITSELLRSGTPFDLAESGDYRAIAVEWSGLESKPSPALPITRGTPLNMLADKPADFTWTHDRWIVDGHEITAADGKTAPQATREIVHLHDSVIHREQHVRGVLATRQDLNAEGKPIREQHYREGKLTQRQYTDRDGVLVSRELFGADGFIAESVRYERQATTAAAVPKEADHWWFQRGMPVKQLKEGREFSRQGDQWTYTSDHSKEKNSSK